jgi:hypothetical protein
MTAGTIPTFGRAARGFRAAPFPASFVMAILSAL